jgi:hypothetical protein
MIPNCLFRKKKVGRGICFETLLFGNAERWGKEIIIMRRVDGFEKRRMPKFYDMQN